MLEIIKKDLSILLTQFFTYIILIIFQLLSFGFFWFFEDTSFFSSGFIEANQYFSLMGYLLMLFTPGFAMSSFSQEYKEETIQLILIKPIGLSQVIVAKHLTIVIILMVSISFHIIYFLSLYALSYPAGNIDIQAIISSFLGLFIILFLMTGIGVMASSFTAHQILAFVLGIFIIFLIYDAPYYLAETIYEPKLALFVNKLSIYHHFKNLSKGIWDFRNILYILALYGMAFLVTIHNLKKRTA